MPSYAVPALLAVLASGVSQTPCPDSVVALFGANVLTMRSSEVTPNLTVVVRCGVIEVVGPANRVRVPSGALRIEARDKFLMPGLADFHTHVVERGDLALYLASGVTTVANMGSPQRALTFWRDSIRAGQMTGPESYVGAYVNGPAGVGGIHTAQSNSSTQITQKQQQDFRRLIRPCEGPSQAHGPRQLFFEKDKLDPANRRIFGIAGSIGENPVAVSA